MHAGEWTAGVRWARCPQNWGVGVWFGQPLLGKQLTIQRRSRCSAACLSEPSQRFRTHSAPTNARTDWLQASLGRPAEASETRLNSMRWHWALGFGSLELADRPLAHRRSRGADQFDWPAESSEAVEMRALATLDPHKLVLAGGWADRLSGRGRAARCPTRKRCRRVIRVGRR